MIPAAVGAVVAGALLETGTGGAPAIQRFSDVTRNEGVAAGLRSANEV